MWKSLEEYRAQVEFGSVTGGGMGVVTLWYQMPPGGHRLPKAYSAGPPSVSVVHTNANSPFPKVGRPELLAAYYLGTWQFGS